MGYKRFSLLLTFRLVLALASLMVLAYLLSQPGFYAGTLLLILIIVFQGWEISHFVARTNQELSRFLDAVRYADFSQKFDLDTLGAKFPVLGDTLNGIMARYRDDRSQQEADLNHLQALIEQVPIPLISLANNGQLTLWNNAARRLFGAVDLAQASHLQQFGEAFYRAITDIRVGERRLVKLLSDDQELTLAVVASEMTSAGHSEKILSLQNIQQELDDTQLDAWQELVRVLTHEILNSITPVASLSKTSVQLLEDLTDRLSAELELSDELGDELADIKEAVETVARRSDGLMNFVASYRKLTRLPSPQRESFSIRDLFDGLMRIMAARDDASNIAVTTRIMPESLMLQADRAMIEQVLINLLQNASQANTSKATVEVSLGARLNRRGQIAIEVADNGPGIPAALVKRVFVPFFTTRRDGSGVGLALSRQIMIAHGGNISAGRAPAGGALITLNF
jgi:two-component system, NtrC family, nitrogen regulation sensor histidine kinase NtrY